MTIAEGLYRAQFATPLGQGSGVVYFAGGTVGGGDSMMAYTGTLEESADDGIRATIRVFKHTDVPGMQTVLGTDTATLNFTGSQNGSGAINLTATNPGGGSVSVALTQIA